MLFIGVVANFSSFRSSELSSPSELLLFLAPIKEGNPWLSKRSWTKLSNSGNVRNIATVLAVLVATKLHSGNGHTLSDLE